MPITVNRHLDGHAPPFRYSLDAPSHLLANKQELNKIIREDIYRQYIQVTWVDPPWAQAQDGLLCKAFHGDERWPHHQTTYTLRHWMHALKIPLGQFQVGSHQLQVEANHHISQADKSCASATNKISRQRSISFSVAPSIMRS
jgi:hypothetical protein